jgi:hypothetical protein
MPIQLFHSATLFPSTQVYCVNALGWSTLSDVSGIWSIDVDNAIIADFNSFFSPLPANFLYVCNWCLCFTLKSAIPVIDGSFPGNPVRKKYGFYALNRGGYIYTDDTIRYDLQVSQKSAFIFGNIQPSNNSGLIGDIGPAGSRTRIYAFGLDFFAGSAPSVVGLLNGASRASGTFAVGTTWDIQIQYNLSVLLVSNDTGVTYQGLIL